MSYQAFYGMNHDHRLHLVDLAVSSLQLCGGKLTEGIFVGAFLSMSSTAVVYSNFTCIFAFFNIFYLVLHRIFPLCLVSPYFLFSLPYQ